MPLHDATEYLFATPSRRLLVREEKTPDSAANLDEVARRHAERLVKLVGATGVAQLGSTTTAQGATASSVVATLPPTEGATDRTPQTRRMAFLRFPGGPIVELALQAPAADLQAETEFRRLLDSVRPGPARGSLEGVSSSLAAGPSGRPGQVVGSVRIDLTPDYQGPPHFLIVSDDGSQRFYLERGSADEVGTQAASFGTLLGSGVSVTRTADNKPIRYEAGVRPRLSPMTKIATAVVGPSESLVTGSVGGTKVLMRVTMRSAGLDPQALGEQLLRDLNREP